MRRVVIPEMRRASAPRAATTRPQAAASASPGLVAMPAGGVMPALRTLSTLPALRTAPYSCAGPATRPRIVVLQGLTMGTTWQVKCVPPAGLAMPGLHDGIQAVLDQVVAEMSTWEPGSNLSRFNAARPGTVVPLAANLHRVLRYAIDVARDSGGACDPTAGALVNVWGFGPGSAFASAGFEPPSAARIAAARSCSGWRRLEPDPAGRPAAVQPGGLQLDLSSIAKGFGVDQVASHLRQAGFGSFLVEVGGELRGAGIKPDGQPWWVRLEEPEARAGVVDTVVALHGLSVATSGDYRRYFDAGEARYCHTIDPRSGRPIDADTASVTVLHQECMAADALSTALMVMGWREGLAWANRRGVAALFRIRQRRSDAAPGRSAARFSEHMTERFAGLLD